MYLPTHLFIPVRSDIFQKKDIVNLSLFHFQNAESLTNVCYMRLDFIVFLLLFSMLCLLGPVVSAPRGQIDNFITNGHSRRVSH